MAVGGKGDPGGRNSKCKAFKAGTYLAGCSSSMAAGGCGRGRGEWEETGGSCSRGHGRSYNAGQTLDFILSEWGHYRRVLAHFKSFLAAVQRRPQTGGGGDTIGMMLALLQWNQ